VLYGHKTSKKTMFYALQDLASDVIFEDVRHIYIYMPTRILKYGIFAAFPFRDSHILLTVNFRFEHDFNKFFDDVLSIVDTRANYREEYFPRFGEDKILTLSTCLRENRLKRYIVMAVLLSVEGEPLEDGTVGVIDRSNK
jgi:sortase B